jgi:hypothetical protein
MVRKLALVATMTLVPACLLVTLAPSASALVKYPGSVSCTSAGGTITFSPPMLANGNASTETLTVTNPVKPCTPTNANVPPSIHGVVKGKVAIMTAAAPANNCGVFFPSSPGTKMFTPTPSPTKWKATWTPSGVPSVLPFTKLSVINTAGQISFGVTGNVTGSFASPPPGGIALDGGATWSFAAISAACATPTGLSKLKIGTTATDVF